MTQYLTYMHLLTPLHTGGSADEGNLMGIAREVHTEFPYLPSSSLRGKIRAELEKDNPEEKDNLKLKEAAGHFFGQKIKDGNQPTEGEVWFADATLLLFPIASLSHHLVWITCPLWLDRWSRWLGGQQSGTQAIAKTCRDILKQKSALTNFDAKQLYLQTASLKSEAVQKLDKETYDQISVVYGQIGLPDFLLERLVIINDQDCISLVETGLQREVRIAIDNDTKTVYEGSFRSEESIPPEAVLFFPWGTKQIRLDIMQSNNSHLEVLGRLSNLLSDRLQFGGLEGLGRGWVNLKTTQL